MENSPAGAVLVIGVGNPYRRDDGVGLWVAREIRKCAPAGVSVIEHGGEGADLMERWQGARHVILIDAAHSEAEPGSIHRIDCGEQPLPHSMFSDSTHAFGVAEAVELSRVLGKLPGRLIVFGIEGADYTAGTELSPAVRQAIPQAVNAALREISS